MDPKRLLLVMTERLYQDIRFVTEQNPTQIVDDDGAKAYNSLLAKARRHFAGVDHVSDFSDWAPRTIKYKDALVVAGQLAAMVSALVDPNGTLRVSNQRGPSAQPDFAPMASAPTPPTAPTVPPGLAQAHRNLTPLPIPEGQPSGFASNRVGVPKITTPPPRPLDEELYGSVKPPRRNDDGTIPFSLE